MEKAAAYGLVLALLTTGCARSVPRLEPPTDLSVADRQACDELAERAKAQVRGRSLWGGAAMGVAGGALFGAAALARGNASESDGAWVLPYFGAAVAIGAGVGAGVVVVRNASVRESAGGDAMDACLRPAFLARELGAEHAEVARSLHALGFRYYRLGEFAKAEPLFARALAIQEKSLGVDAPEVATTLHDYAALLRWTGRAAEAEALERRADAIRRANR